MLLLKHLVIILVGILISASCINVKKTNLDLEASYKIDVKEPSGLSINDSGTALYTVSDENSNIYKLSLTGEVIETYRFKGANLEGVSTYTEHELLLADESSKEIVVFNMLTGASKAHKIKYKNDDKNSGIEGVAFDKKGDRTFILNEKNPGKLIELRNDFSVKAKYKLNFAADYSGIFYDNAAHQLWILSDQNKTVNKCTMQGELIESFKIGVIQPEGIAVLKNHIYIVCDAKATLYVYKKP